jgi:hypothetical protein
MSLAVNSVVSLCAAEPGWVTEIDHARFPVVAWAVVVDRVDDDGRMLTSVEPAFVHEGGIVTASQFRDAYGDGHLIEVRHP